MNHNCPIPKEKSRKSNTSFPCHLLIGKPDPIYYGPKFTAKVVRDWLAGMGVSTLFIEPGSPWENGYVESFAGRFKDELLNGEIFDTLLEARVVIERWRRAYNQFRPHSSLGYKPPDLEAYDQGVITLQV
ncbi:hypothetical protein LCGC14_0975060 [marine sediment metagenome]|uniref:Integrase catalytic domain-containing protein n=1 Tax=marine sediment metagenome TaxID=412755 RepID=A0A0F9QTR3_9ZZZZ